MKGGRESGALGAVIVAYSQHPQPTYPRPGLLTSGFLPSLTDCPQVEWEPLYIPDSGLPEDASEVCNWRSAL